MKRIQQLTFIVLLTALGFSFSFAQSVDELLKQGDQYVAEFNHQKALDVYTQADKLSPNNWDVLWRISRAYVDLGREGDENQQGNVWYVDVSVDAGGERYYAKAQSESIEMALDEVVNDISARIRGARGKKETLTRRGGAFIKSLMQRG